MAPRVAMPTPASPTADVCLACGYDLTGLAQNALCPECAFPVVRSRERSPLLRTADPAWLARIRRGLADLSAAAYILLFTVVGGISLTLAAEFLGADRPRAVMSVVALAALGVAAILHARACLRLSAGTHGGFSAARSDRAMLRIAGLLLPVCAAYGLALGPSMGALPPTVARIVQTACQAAAFAYLFSIAAVLRDLETHTPAWGPPLRQRHRNVRKNLIGLLIIVVFVYWISPAPFARRGWGEGLFGLAYLCIAVAVSRVRTAVALEAAIASAAATIPPPSRSPHP